MLSWLRGRVGSRSTRDPLADTRGYFRAKWNHHELPDDDFPPDWYLQMTADLRATRGLPGKDLSDLVNTGKPYPNAIPVLLDWLENLDSRVVAPITRYDESTREFLIRALTTTEARGPRTVELMLSQFGRDPAPKGATLFPAGNAVKYLAGPEHFDEIAAIVTARPDGRQALIEWIGSSRRKAALPILLDQLDDPEVACSVMRVLRRKSLPDDVLARVRPQLEHYRDFPGDKDKGPGELRKQAKLTLNKLYPEEAEGC